MKKMIRKSFLALAMLSAVPISPVAAAPERSSRCAAEYGLASRVSETMSDLTVENRSRGIVYVYWINFQGQREFAARIPPGMMHKFATYVGHAWVISDSATNCRRVFFPSVGAYTYAYS